MNTEAFKQFILDGPDCRKIFKVNENGKYYYGSNPTRKEGFTIQIEDGLIKSTETQKCDKGLCVEDKKFYLIELKGADLSTACKQLESTLEFMEKSFPEYEYLCRAIVSKKPKTPKYYPKSYIKLREKIGIERFKCEVSPYEEVI